MPSVWPVNGFLRLAQWKCPMTDEEHVNIIACLSGGTPLFRFLPPPPPGPNQKCYFWSPP